MPEIKLSKAEERNLEEKILQTERTSVLELLENKNNAANRKNYSSSSDFSRKAS